MKNPIFFSAIMMATTIVACGHDTEAPGNRPGGGGEPIVPAEADFSVEKTNDAVRANSASVALSADDLGVMYMSDGDTYTFVNIDDGRRIDFNPTQTKLSVNGISRTVEEVKHFHSTSTRDWWAILCPGDTAIVVTERL